MDQQDQLNQSLLLAARGEGELFKGKLTAQAQRIAGVGSYYQQQIVLEHLDNGCFKNIPSWTSRSFIT